MAIFRMLDGQEVFIEEDFKVEVMNPLTREQELALFNARHPDQFTFQTEMTLDEIKEHFGTEAVERVKRNLPYSAYVEILGENHVIGGSNRI